MGCTTSTHTQAGWPGRAHALAFVHSPAATPPCDCVARSALPAQAASSRGCHRCLPQTARTPPPPCRTSSHVHHRSVVLHFPRSPHADDNNDKPTRQVPPLANAGAHSLSRPPTCEWADVLSVGVSWHTAGGEARLRSDHTCSGTEGHDADARATRRCSTTARRASWAVWHAPAATGYVSP